MSRAALKSYTYALFLVVAVVSVGGSCAVASSHRLPLHTEAASSSLPPPTSQHKPIVYASASNSANYVYAYDQRTGSQLFTYGPFTAPAYIAMDRKDNLYVAVLGTQAIYVFPYGQTTASRTVTIPDGFGCGAGGSIAVDPRGHIWVAYANSAVSGECKGPGSLAEYDSAGNLVRRVDCFSTYWSVTFDAAGNAFAAGEGSSKAGIVKFVPAKSMCKYIMADGYTAPQVTHDGNLLVIEYSQGNKLALGTYAAPSFKRIIDTTILRGSTAFLALTASNDDIWANRESSTQHGWIYEYAYPGGGRPVRRINVGGIINGITVTPYPAPG